MAKRVPFTAQEERLERLIKNARSELVALKGMIDTARSIVAAQIIKVDDPASPQILRVSEDGALEMGGESPMRIIGAITEEASHTGDTDETTLGTIVVPADSMGPNGCIRIYSSFRAIGAGANHSFRVYFGGSVIQHVYATANNWMAEFPAFVCNRGATNSQGSGIKYGIYHSRAGEIPTSLSVDTTADVDITFTVQNAVAAHTAYLRFTLVEACYRE